MSIPTLITISGTVLNAGGAGRLVFASSVLVRHNASNDVMAPREIEVAVGADGEFTTQVPATNDPAFSPTGWTWEVRAHFPSWKATFPVAIPYDSPDLAIDFSDLVPVPANDTGTLYAAVNHTHEGGGSGPSAGDTVVSSTTYGQVSSAGAASSYSRSDHRHGSVALPTPAAIGAAEEDHTHPGSGGQVATFARGRVTSGDVTLGSEADWTLAPGLSFSLAAVAGDSVEFSVHGLLQQGLTDFFELVVLNAGSIVRFGSTGTASPTTAGEGDPAIYPVNGTAIQRLSVAFGLTLVSGDIAGGVVTFGIAHKGAGSSAKVFASANYPLRWQIRNDHQ